MEGYIVLTVGCFGHADNIPLTKEQKDELDKLHKDKILMSDSICVINKDDYIGDSTKSEIKYAEEHGKDIQFLFPSFVLRDGGYYEMV